MIKGQQCNIIKMAANSQSVVQRLKLANTLVQPRNIIKIQ